MTQSVRLGNRTYRTGVNVHSALVRLGMHVAFRRVRRKTAPTREVRKFY